MKKFAALCLSATLAASLLAGCGSASSAPAPSQPADSASVSQQASSAAAPASSKNLADVLSAIEAVNPIVNPLQFETHEDEIFTLENEVLLTMGNVDDFAIKKSNNQGDSGTILVIHAAAGKAGDVKAELAAYQEAQINYWGNYAEFADAQANAKEGRVIEKGDYVVLVFASLENADYAAIDKAVDEALS